MATWTNNLDLIQPANSSFSGTWDVPVNSNWGILDLAAGNTAVLNLGGGNVTLTSGQFQSAFLLLQGALIFNTAVILATPSSQGIPAGKTWTVLNTCTNSSQFTVTLATTVSGGQVICAPPGEDADVRSDGSNMRYRNMGRIGSYMDLGMSSTPSWITGCTVPPYLNCDGSALNAGLYPALFSLTGWATLPDFRGRVPAYVNQGTGNITTAGGGVNGDAVTATGGAQNNTITANNLPASLPYNDPGHTHQMIGADNAAGATAPSILGNNQTRQPPLNTLATVITGITINPGSPNTPITNLPPMTMSGIRLVRAG